jgi:hypothetical protein
MGGVREQECRSAHRYGALICHVRAVVKASRCLLPVVPVIAWQRSARKLVPSFRIPFASAQRHRRNVLAAALLESTPSLWHRIRRFGMLASSLGSTSELTAP